MNKILRKVAWGSLVAGFILGVALVPATITFNDMTSSAAFCGNSCHSMNWISNDPVYLNATHSKNESGVVATCKDCHLPKGLIEETWAHVRSGSRDLLASVSNDYSLEANWEARRQVLGHEVREKMIHNNSENCRHCHQPLFQQSAKPRVARQHQLAARQEVTCIQCHFNLVHSPVEPTDAERKGINLLPDYERVSPIGIKATNH